MLMKSHTDEYIENVIHKILGSRPYRAVELRILLKDKGIMISYGRLKRILQEMVSSGKIKCKTEGTSIVYYV